MLINRRFINRSPAFSEAGLDLPSVNPVNEKLMVALQAGTYSLNSMIVRPFLILSRFDVKKLVNFWKLPIYPDKTNQKLRYHRNRIRKQLLPLLRFFFNPQVDNLFLQFSEIATSEQLYLDFVATRLFHEFVTLKKNVLKLDISLFYFIPIAIRRKLLKEFLSMYSTKQIKFVYIEILLSSIEQHKKHSFNNSQFGHITKRVHQKTTVTSNYFVKTRKKFNKNYFGLNIYTLSLNLPALQIQSFDCIYIQDFFVTKAKRSHLNLLFFPKLGALFILGGRIIALL